MEEDEVDAKPCVVDAKPALAAQEGKIVAQLQEEVGEAVDEGSSKSDSEYSSLRSRNSRTKGSLIASSGVTASLGWEVSAFSSMAALFCESAMRS